MHNMPWTLVTTTLLLVSSTLAVDSLDARLHALQQKLDANERLKVLEHRVAALQVKQKGWSDKLVDWAEQKYDHAVNTVKDDGKDAICKVARGKVDLMCDAAEEYLGVAKHEVAQKLEQNPNKCKEIIGGIGPAADWLASACTDAVNAASREFSDYDPPCDEYILKVINLMC